MNCVVRLLWLVLFVRRRVIFFFGFLGVLFCLFVRLLLSFVRLLF